MEGEPTEAVLPWPSRVGTPGLAAVRARARAGLRSAALRDAWHAFWVTRLFVWIVGLFAALELARRPGWERYDPGNLTAPFGGLGDLLVAPGTRWDSVWYLAIARDGYDQHLKTAFFPLYPLLAHGVGLPFGSALIGGLLVSGACFVAGLCVVHRLAALELGDKVAGPAVLLIAVFPMSFFFSAVYSESLYLLCSAGAFLAARRDRWAWAGLLGGLAAATRSIGVLLVLPLAWLYLFGPRARPRPGWRYPLRPSAAWLALIPAGLVAYLGYLDTVGIDPMSPFHAQDIWMRHFTGPIVGVGDGVRAAWDGVRQLASGSRTPVYFTAAVGDPFRIAGQNIMLFSFFVLGLVALAGVVRRLPLAYAVYVGVALLLPLSTPVTAQPLMSLPRFLAVLFPLHLWAAAWAQERGHLRSLLIGGAVLLGLFTAQFTA
ncbi:MAG: hypothetical protein JWN32_4127, partial [Solirubrobacterales bacterium]|nr:hypothetical protein [Solirubrobacterales bacterium]